MPAARVRGRLLAIWAPLNECGSMYRHRTTRYTVTTGCAYLRTQMLPRIPQPAASGHCPVISYLCRCRNRRCLLDGVTDERHKGTAHITADVDSSTLSRSFPLRTQVAGGGAHRRCRCVRDCQVSRIRGCLAAGQLPVSVGN
jgi:hypothetical protein